MVSFARIHEALIQLPGLEGPELSLTERLQQAWTDAGGMAWPLAACVLVGFVVIVWKFFDLLAKSRSTHKTVRNVDELLTQQRVDEALETTRESDSPAANILYAGLERSGEGTDRVIKAIENRGLIELSKLESGLVVLATLTNVAPLLGFLGTVLGMIEAFQAIQLAGEVDAQTVAEGIKVALTTTAAGLAIAIPVSIAHNYFVSRIDHLVVDMEESAQKMIDILFSMQAGRSTSAGS